MRVGKMVSTLIVAALVFAGSGLPAMAQIRTGSTQSSRGNISFYAPNGVHTMDSKNPLYSSIQITGGKITGLGKKLVAGAIKLPKGAAIYPGFIDSHSHAISLLTAQSLDSQGKPNWISLANVNVMLLPDCKPHTPPGSTTCFMPVTTQETVNHLLKTATPNAAGWVLGWNYEPSRLVCTVNGVATYGFLCPNFENQSQQTVMQQLDQLQPNYPVLITSESGHIAYVNTMAANLLNICNVSPIGTIGGTTGSAQASTKNNSQSSAKGTTSGTSPLDICGVTTNGTNGACYKPTVNTVEETKLARTGQLDEDLAIYAIQQVEGLLAADYGGTSQQKRIEFFSKQIRASLRLYSQLGYTTVQEGAASKDVIKTYMATAASTVLPVTVAFLEYDGVPADDYYQQSVACAVDLQNSISSDNLDMFVAGMKAFADGSNQGYTGAMASPVSYMNLSKPFLDSHIFQQPYDGLPDFDQHELKIAADAAHKGGLPLWVHTNGNQAQTNVLNVLETQKAEPLRDVVVHFTMPTQAQVNSVPRNQVGATFLMNDFYFYYQPLCEQVLGVGATQNIYPALWAKEHKMHYTLHSDAAVTPPSPLFSMWVASTRNYQQHNWLPKMSTACQQAVKTSQKISRLEAMRAYTTEAAWLYNRETSIGSLQPGFQGDLVVLSADPLAAKADPSKIYVLYTVHKGNIVYPTSKPYPAKTPAIWPK